MLNTITTILVQNPVPVTNSAITTMSGGRRFPMTPEQREVMRAVRTKVYSQPVTSDSVNIAVTSDFSEVSSTLLEKTLY